MIGDSVDLATVRCDKQIEVLVNVALHHNHILFQLSEEPTEKILSNRKIVEAYNKKIAMESDPTVKIANIKQQVSVKVVWIREKLYSESKYK